MPINYSEYEAYSLNPMPQAEFAYYADEAVTAIRVNCHGRIPLDITQLEDQEPDTYAIVKKCVYHLCDLLRGQDKAYNQADGIASESTDGHSVTFEKREKSDQSMDAYRLIRKYLMPTGLLYSGRDPYWDNRKW